MLLNAAINPLIYLVRMKRVRETLRDMVRGRKRGEPVTDVLVGPGHLHRASFNRTSINRIARAIRTGNPSLMFTEPPPTRARTRSLQLPKAGVAFGALSVPYRGLQGGTQLRKHCLTKHATCPTIRPPRIYKPTAINDVPE